MSLPASVISSACGGNVVEHALAKIYKATNGRWTNMNIMGDIALIKDKSGNYYLKVCSSSEQEVFSEQLYSEPLFIYEDTCPFFHMFEGEKSVFGISFASEKDASSFSRAVKAAASEISEKVVSTPAKKTPPPTPARPTATTTAKPTSSSAITSTTASVTTTPHESTSTASSQRSSRGTSASATPSTARPVATKTVNTTSSSTKKKKNKSFFGLFGKQSDDDETFTMSDPTNFRHVSHIGLDAEGFDIRNIPPEWKKLFHAAGVKKKDLENPETRMAIQKAIDDHQNAPPVTDTSYGGDVPPAPPAPTAPPAPAVPQSLSTSSRPPETAGRGALLAQIQQGTKLQKVEESEKNQNRPPDVNSVDGQSLMGAISAVIQTRRQAIQDDVDDDDDDEEWSD